MSQNQVESLIVLNGTCDPKDFEEHPSLTHQYVMTLGTIIALKHTCKVSHTLLYQQICVTFSVLQAWIGGIQKFLSRWCRAKSWRQKTGRFGETIRSS